jgi:hypothetical protein
MRPYSPEMAQQFNSDLLAGEADTEIARKAFPRIVFALDHPALRDVFAEHDDRASLSKRRSRNWGIFAVFLATLALLLAANSSHYADQDKIVVRTIGAIGALAGISSVVIAVLGVMYRKRKVRWLTDRLATERLRQFHFQHYIAKADVILAAAGDAAKTEDFLKKRDGDLEKLKADLLIRLEPEFHALVESDDMSEGLFFSASPSDVAGDPALLAEYFGAYETLRFRRQLDYCNLLLSEQRSILKNAPARQAKFFAAAAMLLIMSILALDAMMFIGSLGDLDWIRNPWFQSAGISAAFIALAVRTLGEGFQVEGEVARMRHYRQSIARIYERFRNADAPREKLAAMIELEKTAYDEMVTFLKSHNEAEFVM